MFDSDIRPRYKIAPALLCIDKATPDYCVDRDSVRYAIPFHFKQLTSFFSKYLVVNKLSPEKTYASCNFDDDFRDHILSTLCILNIAIFNIKKREVELWPN
mgnify:CR=1 FL=1